MVKWDRVAGKGAVFFVKRNHSGIPKILDGFGLSLGPLLFFHFSMTPSSTLFPTLLPCVTSLDDTPINGRPPSRRRVSIHLISSPISKLALLSFGDPYDGALETEDVAGV